MGSGQASYSRERPVGFLLQREPADAGGSSFQMMDRLSRHLDDIDASLRQALAYFK